MAQQTARLQFTITNGTSVSDAIAIHGERISVIEMPIIGWDTANLTFLGSNDNSNFFSLFDDAGAEIVVQAAAARRIHVTQSTLNQHAFFKIRSGVAATPVTQTSTRYIIMEVWS